MPFSNIAMANTIERHANILRSIKLMAARNPLSDDEKRMMQSAIDDLDEIAEQLYNDDRLANED